MFYYYINISGITPLFKSRYSYATQNKAESALITFLDNMREFLIGIKMDGFVV